MNVKHLNNLKGWKQSPGFCSAFRLMPLLAAVFFVCQSSQAQQAFMPSTGSVDPLQTVHWVSGPQSGTLGVADLNIPAGYRFTDANGARLILDSFNSPVPDDLIGVLAPNSGKWWAILEYSPKGFVKNAEAAKLDASALLKEIQSQTVQKNPDTTVTGMNWQSKPVYDTATHSLTWAVQIVTPTTKVLNQSIATLGRHGVLQITAVQTYPVTDAASLKELASNVTFKDGERYTDFQSTDKVAAMGLAEIITGQKPASAAGGLGAIAVWIYFGLGMCVLCGGLVLFFRRKDSRSHAPVPARVPAAAAVAVKNGAASNGMASHATFISTNGFNGNGNGNGNGHHAKAVPATPAVHSRGVKNSHRNRRKRVFDYPKFYTNVMRELSLHSYGPATTNGKSTANGHANGNGKDHANGHANGAVNGHANGSPAPANGATSASVGAHEAVKAEIVELIATQKNLIEEQKCLLQQQTRLIEEKRWLIQEQTAFLKGQSELLDQQQYPLKLD